VITVMAGCENPASGNTCTAVHTASWIAPASDAHSQQRFSYVAHRGVVDMDQARRGYTSAADARPDGTPATGHVSNNPLFFRYAPTASGRFAGRSCYGYVSFEHFVSACNAVEADDGAVLSVIFFHFYFCVFFILQFFCQRQMESEFCALTLSSPSASPFQRCRDGVARF
jgi:hypothetical protein